MDPNTGYTEAGKSAKKETNCVITDQIQKTGRAAERLHTVRKRAVNQRTMTME